MLEALPSERAHARSPAGRRATRRLLGHEVQPDFSNHRRESTRGSSWCAADRRGRKHGPEGFAKAMAAPSNPQRGSPRRTTRRGSSTRVKSTRETFGKRGGVRPQRVDSSPPNPASRRPLFRWQPTSFRRFRRLSKAARFQQHGKREVDSPPYGKINDGFFAEFLCCIATLTSE
jgi:hypothetical protein